MPRRPPLLRDRRHENLTPNQTEYLCRGWTYFPPHQPFDSEDAARAAWEEYKDEILALRDAPPEIRPAAGAHFKSGTRPYGWWKFEQGQDPPFAQGGLLEELGELQPGEREKALELLEEDEK